MTQELAVGTRVTVLVGPFEGRTGAIVEPRDRYGRFGVDLGRTRAVPRGRGQRKPWPYWFVAEHLASLPEGDDRG